MNRTGDLSGNEIAYACRNATSWWTRAYFVNELSADHVSGAALRLIYDVGMTDSVSDVANAAAWNSFLCDHKPRPIQLGWNRSGTILLREVGVIKRKQPALCGISASFTKLDKRIVQKNWKKFFGAKYSQAEKQAVEIAALSGTNITAFVNTLDVFDELLLDALFKKDTSIGIYTLGKIGSVLHTSTSKFKRKYPATHALAQGIRDARSNMYSHPLIKATSKPTKKISFKFLPKARKLLFFSISELAASGVL